MITFGSKANRCYSIFVPFNNKEIIIDTYFSRCNTYIGFNHDSIVNDMIINDNVSSTIYKDINESIFCKTFLKTTNFISDSLDIKNQYNGVIDDRKDRIHNYSVESVRVSKIKTANGDFESTLNVYSFSLTDYMRDFLYVIAERQHIDTVIGKKLVRTSAIQISKKHICDNILKMYNHYNFKPVEPKNSIPFIVENPKDSPLRDIFPDKELLNVRGYI